MEDPIQLQTERLILRLPSLADLDGVVGVFNDEEWAKYVRRLFPWPYSRQDGEEFIDGAAQRSSDLGPHLVLELAGKVVGVITLELRAEDRIAEIGYGLARSVWGKGLAVEAVSAVIDWTFNNYDVVKVFALADSRNDRSIRVLEKLGLQPEGLLRQHRFARDGQTDEVLFGVLKDEWVAAHAAASD